MSDSSDAKNLEGALDNSKGITTHLKRSKCIKNAEHG